MEYYRKCNMCDKIDCYTDADINKNALNAQVSATAAIGSMANAIAGTKYDMYEMNKISQNNSSKIIDLKKCLNCGSIDTILVTKDFAKFSNKRKGIYTTKELLNEAEKYLLNEDYENAICFANILFLENEYLYEACKINLLSSYKIKSLDDLSKIEEDIYFNKNFQNTLKYAPSKEKEILLSLTKDNKNKFDNIKYNNALELSKHNNIKDLEAAIKIFSLLENFNDSKEQIIVCKNKIDELTSTKKKNKKKIIKIVLISLLIIISISIPIIYFKYFKKYQYVGEYVNDEDYYIELNSDMNVETNMGKIYGWAYENKKIYCLYSYTDNGSYYMGELVFEIKDKNTLCLQNHKCEGFYKFEKID